MSIRHAACFLTLAGFSLLSGAACSIFEEPSAPTAVAPQPGEDEPEVISTAAEQVTANPAAAARSQAAPPIPLDGLPWFATGPVAIVDGVEIPAREFNQLAYERSFPGVMPMSVAYQLIDSLVDRYLIEREIRRAGIRISVEAIETQMGQKQMSGARDRGLGQDLLRAERWQRVRVGVGLRELVKRDYNVAVTDDDVREFYEQDPASYHVAEQVKASHILVKVDRYEADAVTLAAAKSRAARIAAEAHAGVDFAELARRRSDGPTASRGGDLGFFAHVKMVRPFADAAFALDVGEVSDPVRSQFGFHVIKLFDRRGARTIPLEEARAGIVERLEKEKLRSATQQLKRTLREAAEIIELRENIEQARY